MVEISPEYRYATYSGKGGHYDCSDLAIEKQPKEEGWVVKDGKHHCSEECSSENELISSPEKQKTP